MVERLSNEESGHYVESYKEIEKEVAHKLGALKRVSGIIIILERFFGGE